MHGDRTIPLKSRIKKQEAGSQLRQTTLPHGHWSDLLGQVTSLDMSDEEEMMNNDPPVTTTTTTKTTSESPISKAMAAHLESLMQGDEADDQDLVSAPVLDLGPEADEEEFLDNDYTMDGDGQEDEGEYGDIYADAEVEVEPTLEPINIPIIFSTSKSGGAWDDRDLVTAFDAAKEEFHLHNPGPGSWLDKTTAALAKGKPLVGAQYGETKSVFQKPCIPLSFPVSLNSIIPDSHPVSSSLILTIDA